MYDAFPPPQLHRSGAWGPRPNCGCEDVIALVAKQKNVPIRLLIHKSRSRKPVARARQLAMYLSHVVLGCSLIEIGEAFGRDRTTVSYACGLIEDMRDERSFDEEVCALERLIETAMDPEALSHAA